MQRCLSYENARLFFKAEVWTKRFYLTGTDCILEDEPKEDDKVYYFCLKRPCHSLVMGKYNQGVGTLKVFSHYLINLFV